jgi:Ca2+-binding EF-hand superfamily protein
MLLPMLILAMLAPEGTASDSRPIVVSGHAWAPFISPMGEPFRAHTPTDDTLAKWFYQADRNRDGSLSIDEMQADAKRFFGTIDSNGDGEIDPEELVNYEWEIAPDIQLMTKTRRAPGEPAPEPSKAERERAYLDDVSPRPGRRHREEGLQGAARYSLLNLPEPVAAADADFNRGISAAEFQQAAIDRFQLLDSAHQGRLTLAQLQVLRASYLATGKAPKKSGAPDARIGSPLPPPGN